MPVEKIQFNLPRELIRELESIAEREQRDQNLLMQKFILEGIKQSKLDFALSQYREGKASISKAAELANVDLWSIHDEIQKRGLMYPSTVQDLELDLQTIRKRLDQR